MGISYKAIDFKQTLFMMLMAVAFFIAVPNAQAENPLFVVKGIKVDETAENAVAAQDKAFQIAQIKAFKILAQRLMDNGKIREYKTPDNLTIAALINDFEVTNEQISGTRYVGTYTIRFREDATKKYFSLSGSDLRADSARQTPIKQSILILPFYLDGNKLTIWSENNIWMQAWGSRQLDSPRASIEVPIGELMDVADLGETEGLNFNPARLKSIETRYGTDEAAIVVAAPDDRLRSVLAGNEPARGALSLSLYRTDRQKAELVLQQSLAPLSGETRDQFYDRAVDLIFEKLQGRWKLQTLSGGSAIVKSYNARVAFNSISQWVKIQQALNNTSGLSSLSILSIKPREALVKFDFRGNAVRLREMLARGNLGLSEPYNNAPSHQFSGPKSKWHAQELYDITMETARSGGFYVAPENTGGQGEVSRDPNVHTF